MAHTRNTPTISRHSGHTVRGIQLPGSVAEISKPATKDSADDIKTIQAVTSDEASKGFDVVLVSHSYGGIPTTEWCEGHLKKDLEKEGKRVVS